MDDGLLNGIVVAALAGMRLRAVGICGFVAGLLLLWLPSLSAACQWLYSSTLGQGQASEVGSACVTVAVMLTNCHFTLCACCILAV